MLDSVLRAAGYRTGLYTSPHLLDFNERARIDGVDATDDELIEQFEAVEAARGATSLTYFEFTTLAILRLMAAARLDAVVLEIGLGGRLDAVNLIDADVAIVTSIDLDHMDYLGADARGHRFREGPHLSRRAAGDLQRSATAASRCSHTPTASAPTCGASAATSTIRAIGSNGPMPDATLRRTGLPYPALRGANQLLNASGVLAALEALAERLPVSQQAVRQGLLTVDIPARFQVLPGRPTTILDVAHNPHAAAVLAQNLDSMGFFPETHAVFGMLNDKDIAGVIAKLGARIDHWHVGSIGWSARNPSRRDCRAVRARLPRHRLDLFDLGTRKRSALPMLAARERASADDRILAFGSFLTVADVMRVLRVVHAALRISTGAWMSLAFWRRKHAAVDAAPRSSRSTADDDAGRADPTAALRARARRRLIGAAALLLLVVIVVPMVLDPEPRPVPDNIPIDIPSEKTKFSPRLALPPVPAPDNVPLAPPPDAPPPATKSAGGSITGPKSGAAMEKTQPNRQRRTRQEARRRRQTRSARARLLRARRRRRNCRRQ